MAQLSAADNQPPLLPLSANALSGHSNAFQGGQRKERGRAYVILSEVKDERVRTKPRAVPQCFHVNMLLFTKVQKIV